MMDTPQKNDDGKRAHAGARRRGGGSPTAMVATGVPSTGGGGGGGGAPDANGYIYHPHRHHHQAGGSDGRWPARGRRGLLAWACRRAAPAVGGLLLLWFLLQMLMAYGVLRQEQVMAAETRKALAWQTRCAYLDRTIDVADLGPDHERECHAKTRWLSYHHSWFGTVLVVLTRTTVGRWYLWSTGLDPLRGTGLSAVGYWREQGIELFGSQYSPLLWGLTRFVQTCTDEWLRWSGLLQFGAIGLVLWGVRCALVAHLHPALGPGRYVTAGGNGAYALWPERVGATSGPPPPSHRMTLAYAEEDDEDDERGACSL